MKPKDPTQPNDHEKNEARVLAMLLGEIDPSEQAEVEALLAENTELRTFRDLTAKRLGLMEEAVKGKAAYDASPLRLDPERRGELEELLASETSRGENDHKIEVVPFSPTDKTTKANPKKWAKFLPLASAAAVVVLAALVARIALEDYQEEEKMAYVDEQSPQNLVTIESKERAARRENTNLMNGQVIRKRAQQKEAISDIKLPEMATLGSDHASLIQAEELDKLLPTLEDAAADSSNEILTKRLADDITIINDLRSFDKSAFEVDQPESNDFERTKNGSEGYAHADLGALDTRDSLGARSATFASAPPAPSEPTAGSSGLLADRWSSPFLTKPKSDTVPEPSGAGSTAKLLASGQKESEESLSLFRSRSGEEGKKGQREAVGKTVTESKASSVFGEPREGDIDAKQLKAELAAGKGIEASTVDAGTIPPPLPAPSNPEIFTTEQALSTFYPKVSKVSFRLAETKINQGQWPAKPTIRSEDFVNAFAYGDPQPAGAENMAFKMERTRHPFVKDREMLRFSLICVKLKNKNTRPLNLVVALDNSLSMKGAQSMGIVKNALRGLAKHVTGADRVSLVTFANQAQLRLDNVTSRVLLSSLDKITTLSTKKGTNLEKALDLAFATARKRFLPKGNNRVLLLSDGAANSGERIPRALKTMVDKHRAFGISLDCIGLSSSEYADDMLDSLSSNGSYGYFSGANTNFETQFAGILRPTASELKVQVQFNPDRVELYRHVGFEKNLLGKQYFDGKSIGGAEISSDEAANALYVMKLNPQGKGDLGVLRVQYRESETGNQKLREWKLTYDKNAPAFADASVSMRLAVHAATFAEWLGENPYSAGFEIERAINELQAIRNDFPDKASVDRLSEMMIRSRAISR